MKKTTLLLYSLLCLFIACQIKKNYPTVSTFAGNGIMGLTNGKGNGASFANMMGVAIDGSGNVFVADSHNNLIRKITPDGLVTTFAGNGTAGEADGRPDQASFFSPEGIAVDKSGYLYIADTRNSLIRKIDPEGYVSTLAGIRADSIYKSLDTARFDNPAGIAVDGSGNIYVADWGNDIIRKISPGGKVTTIAGDGNPGFADGLGQAASFYLPGGLSLDSAGNLYIADTYNNLIRKIDKSGMVSTLAGIKVRGVSKLKRTPVSFLHPFGMAMDPKGNLYIANTGMNDILKLNPQGGLSLFAGSGKAGAADGRDTLASFYKPYGIAIDGNGNFFVADYQNNLIRKINF